MIQWLVLYLVAATPASPTVQADTPPKVSSPSEATAATSPSTVASLISLPSARTPTLDLSVGTGYASGDFGGAHETTIATTSFGARARFGDLQLSASIPYMRIRSSGVVVTGIDSTAVVISPDKGGRKRSANGIGDLTLGVAYSIPARGDGPDIELTGRVKVPTASRTSGLSTSRTDYSAGVQLSRTIGRVGPFMSATYRIFGDPRGFDLRNGFAASAGLSWSLGRRTVILASYHYAATASRLVHDAHELFLGASRPIANGHVRLTAFGTAGLSEGAPAAAGGIGLSMTL